MGRNMDRHIWIISCFWIEKKEKMGLDNGYFLGNHDDYKCSNSRRIRSTYLRMVKSLLANIYVSFPWNYCSNQSFNREKGILPLLDLGRWTSNSWQRAA